MPCRYLVLLRLTRVIVICRDLSILLNAPKTLGAIDLPSTLDGPLILIQVDCECLN